jgi:predicted nucleic acid-binding Zn ribbon protein
MNDTCVCCGAVIPEGHQVCPTCIKQLQEYKVEGEKAIAIKKFVAKGADDEQAD